MPAFQSGTCAQDETPLGTGTVRPRVQMADLETYYMPDKEGHLIPVFRLPFEEFERLLQQDRSRSSQNAQHPVGFRVVEASFSADIAEQEPRVDMRMKLKITLLASGRQSIPLGLNGWVLSGRLQGPNSVQHYLTRSEAGGFVLHASGPINEILEFDLPLSRRIQRVGHLYQLPIGFPYPTQTSFRLTLPQTGLTLRGGDVVDLLSVENEGRTVVTVRELTEKSVIAWQETPANPISFSLKARIESNTRVQALGLGRWQVTSLIDMTPLGEPLASFVMVLPPTAVDLTSPQNNVRVERLTRSEAQQAASQVPEQQQYFRLTLVNPVNEATQIQVSYSIAGEPLAGQNESEVEFRGPIFLDCAFGSGNLELVKDRELSNTWQLGGGISLAAASGESRDVISFVVERQDFRLILTNRPQAAQVRVETEYTITLIANQRFVMTVNFNCQIQGKFSDSLWVDLHDWNFVSGGSGVQLRDRRMDLDPTSTTLGIGGELLFHCILEAESSDLVHLKLPQLQGEAALVQQPANVILLMDDPSREFRFDPEASTVIRDNAVPNRFRSRDANSEVVLSGQFGLRPQRVELKQWVEVSESMPVDLLATTLISDRRPDSLSNRHVVQLNVAHRPLAGLGFLMEDTAPLSHIQVSLGNEILQFKRTPITVAGRSFYALEFLLGSDRLRGELDLSVTYLLALPEEPQPGTDRWSVRVPLIQIVTEPMSRLASLKDEAEFHEFLRRQIEGVQIQNREVRTPISGTRRYTISQDHWAVRGVLESPGLPDRWKTWVLNGQWPTSVHLNIEGAPRPVAETVVEQVRVRTWWAGEERREQFLARIETPERNLRVDVGPEIDVRRVLVNQKSVPFEFRRDREQLEFSLVDINGNQRQGEAIGLLGTAVPVVVQDYEIEIWYSRIQPSSWWTQATLQLPRLPNQQWCRDFGWEFSLNDAWRLFWVSTELTPAVPKLDRLGTESSENLAARQTVLHFSSTNEPSHQGMILVNRQAIRLLGIFGMASVILVGWFSEGYRRPAFWLSIAAVIAVVSWVWPELGWDLTPWIAPTVLVVMAVVWWEYVATRPVPLVPEVHEDHTTRTYWREMSSVSERSAETPVVRKTDSVGDSVA